MTNIKQELEELLRLVIERGASDLHISVGRKPTLRIDGTLVLIEEKDVIDDGYAERFVMEILKEDQRARFLENKELDFSYNFEDIARFRVNVFMQKGKFAAAMRLIPTAIRTLDELGHPPILHNVAKTSQGFFLVVGPSGQGKSTTLAAMVDEVNHQRACHIVTIEDPIEYLFKNDRSIVDQREVGQDTKSFNSALRSVLRQDPDVIMVGEMRDPETISAAITAAETGHLVFSTLHTNNAAQTIDRIIDSFPPAQQNQIRAQLSGTLLGVLSRRLIPRIGGGRAAAFELLLANAAVKNLIRENKAHQIDLVIETSAEEGMISLNRSLASLVKKGEISYEDASSHSTNPSELRILVSR
ncbi:type IV pili twitching motility protein PilT [Candidatus Azambacteria bacterium RBG_16_47_10]|uniref:Type IV pili twitching motility protein PilT n=1 Tax=Candidatus Azambacteria bacterium RBG_16_47_10 TaxID=1797292 RepID=A0A1F5B008_9BACT|nr:MAG: type IV pili twitching motility protein PilT [Candidatus Azambacteria bacterium RBG_16_47_10]